MPINAYSYPESGFLNVVTPPFSNVVNSYALVENTAQTIDFPAGAAVADQEAAIAIGDGAYTGGLGSVAIGTGTAGSDYTVAIGTGANGSQANANGSNAIGYNVVSDGTYSTTLGTNVKAQGNNSMAFGAVSGATTTQQTIAGANSVAFISAVQGGRGLSASNAFMILGSSLILDPSTSGGGGISAVQCAVDFSRGHDAMLVPSGTDAQQPGQTGQPTAVNGMIRYDTTSNTFQGYINGAWKTFTLI
jgi:hypothetical protein